MCVQEIDITTPVLTFEDELELIFFVATICTHVVPVQQYPYPEILVREDAIRRLFLRKYNTDPNFDSEDALDKLWEYVPCMN